MGISIKLRLTAILTLDDGSTVDVERIGRGRFTTAWRNSHNVYLQTHESDYGKEILSSLAKMDRNPHIPDVQQLGWFDGNKPYRLYRAPLYGKLTAKSKKAWEQFKSLQSMAHDCWTATIAARHSVSIAEGAHLDAQNFNERFREMVDCSSLPDTIKEAIEQLINSCYNYGAGYMVEIAKHNCAIDENGILILLDPVFNIEQVRAKLPNRAR